VEAGFAAPRYRFTTGQQGSQSARCGTMNSTRTQKSQEASLAEFMKQMEVFRGHLAELQEMADNHIGADPDSGLPPFGDPGEMLIERGFEPHPLFGPVFMRKTGFLGSGRACPP
jgi:hypothetical protein